MVISKSICHLKHPKMDESQVNCWLNQMVKIRKDKGAGGSHKRETTLLEGKHQDGSHIVTVEP